jgi:hypothetical protein
MMGNVERIPDWVPRTALRYLEHTEKGVPIRVLARDAGCHASTVLRQIRYFEARREDPLVDDALKRLGLHVLRPKEPGSPPKETKMTAVPRPFITQGDALSEARLKREGRRALRRLCETGAILVVAPAMDKAVIVREMEGKEPTRIGIVDKPVAEAMALKGWIQLGRAGRVSRYAITRAGREALDHLLSDVEDEEEEEQAQAAGFAEAPSGFSHASPSMVMHGTKRKRYGISETPLVGLARRKGPDGQPFLPDDLVRAGERLREDFELAQMEPQIAQNWDHFLTAGVTAHGSAGAKALKGSAARLRVTEALRDLGPGLGDVALRCCCYLEGLERIEKRMGWSARSGKIVLRIALQRLKRHYDGLGEAGGMIG